MYNRDRRFKDPCGVAAERICMMKKLNFNIRGVLVAVLICLTAVLLVSCGEWGGSHPATSSTDGLIYEEKADGTLAVIGYEGEDTAIVIDLYKGLAVTSVGVNAFAGNENITSVSLGAHVSKIDVAAFAGCTGLAAFDASASVVDRIGNAAFLGCDALASVSLPVTVTSIGVDAFLGCDALATLAFGGDAMEWTRVRVGAHNECIENIVTLANGETFDGAFISGDCTELIKWLLDGEGNLTVTGEGHIPDYGIGAAPWAELADKIKTVTVDEGIDVVGKNAFGGLTALTSVTLADSVRLISDSAFYGCTALVEVKLPSNLRRIGSGAFYGCDHLGAVVIPDTVTMVGGGAFMNCTRLATVTLSASMTSLEQWTFSGCERLMTVELPASITSVGVGAFYGCIQLSEITLGGAGLAIEKNAFAGCSSLATAVIRGGEWTAADGNNDFVTAVK